ncbi:LysE/ArgO family amino acid transporter [Pseudooceanicola atlanticus]|uniref:Amino acid transporter n=1 Tax=Pseudooceanicola atlanticus TaxID=1461694 RepID=A0A0A0EGW4_9RHOB|nr:LysE/ArgO family amino acid transporter [Pseudooceanicola atlanticus]KGM49565.1 amino acid transporter [Pseudooceanicola atlanticus]
MPNSPALEPDFLRAFLAAFGLGLSLIVAIGAQNAFVLRQGLRQEHVTAVVLICGVSDAVLITAGVLGFGTLAARLPWLEPAMRYGGAGFLLVYGALTLRSAWRGGQVLDQARGGGEGLGRVVATCLALTWGNPHVYLDTMALMGAVSAPYENKQGFILGGATASMLFFAALGYGAGLLRPVFARPVAWRILDLVIALVMFAIAYTLVAR